jgi:hypothetical protein
LFNSLEKSQNLFLSVIWSNLHSFLRIRPILDFVCNSILLQTKFQIWGWSKQVLLGWVFQELNLLFKSSNLFSHRLYGKCVLIWAVRGLRAIDLINMKTPTLCYLLFLSLFLTWVLAVYWVIGSLPKTSTIFLSLDYSLSGQFAKKPFVVGDLFVHQIKFLKQISDFLLAFCLAWCNWRLMILIGSIYWLILNRKILRGWRGRRV